jgi:hypothetical protein
MMTNGANLPLELERLHDRVLPGRGAAHRNELMREWRRLQRADAHAPFKPRDRRQRQSAQ